MAKKGTLFGKPRNKVIKRPGAFSAAAKRAGMTVLQFARKVLSKDSRYSTRRKQQANLARRFAEWRRKK